MSLGASLVSLTRSVGASAVQVAFGAVRGVAHALSGSDRDRAHEARATAWTAPDAGPVAAPPPSPREPIVTEPTVASRSEAHGGSPGRRADDLYEEAVDDRDVPDPVGELTRDDGEAGLDPAVARAVRAEAVVMKRAARRQKGL
jgi:hypothetical protein